MLTLETLKPGRMGTKDLLARYGPTVLFVRYHEAAGERLKAVELVVQRSCPNREEAPGQRGLGLQARGAARRKMALRIGWREKDLQRRVKGAGGRGASGRRVWVLRRDAACRPVKGHVLTRMRGGDL